jgi:hypothetical protein
MAAGTERRFALPPSGHMGWGMGPRYLCGLLRSHVGCHGPISGFPYMGTKRDFSYPPRRHPCKTLPPPAPPLASPTKPYNLAWHGGRRDLGVGPGGEARWALGGRRQR